MLIFSQNANIPGKELFLEEALTFIGQLNAENYEGYNTWRLPTKKELLTHRKEMHTEARFSYININFVFFYWTATPTKNPHYQWAGSIAHYTLSTQMSKTITEAFIWPCRDSD